jgi:predicted AlkP superfamily phosphohydrolase/phosphomutase
VIVIGWDGADWQLLDQLMERGKMPELASLVREGSSGSLRTIHPPLSPIVWTTMMTGRPPLDHGVLDFTRFDPATRIREPIGSDERRVPAVWTIASTAGRTVAVFGLWATFPAERVNGVIVSDRLMSFQNGAHPAEPGVVYPENRTAWAREALARAESATGDAALHVFAPEIARDPRLMDGLRRVLVETAVYDDLAASWFRDQRPDLTILYIQGTDAIGHLFAPYRPPRMRGVTERDVEQWGGVSDLYYADVDRRLGAWRRSAREAGAALVLVSDHGFYWAEGRPSAAGSAAAATAGRWHRDDGVYVVAVPGGAGAIPKRGRGEVAQVAPTLLALLGIGPGTAMPTTTGGTSTS